MHVIGTAGHVDHGKSTLVQALTGINPDRLKEEQARQMTIDLGFAWMQLPGGETVGIIDVPGHEDFIENMLAGVGGIDAAMLIIAADEGVMPQTREHLAILNLLEVPQLLVVMTKIDLVEDIEWLELVELDIRELLADTHYSATPIVRVSVHTGAGLDTLLKVLAGLLNELKPHSTDGIARLPIDRVFTLSGFGTVVTGTLLGGTLATGEVVEIQPTGQQARIRGLQSHQHAVEIALPGNRTAVNLSGIEKQALQRGYVLAHPGMLQPTQLLDVELIHLAASLHPLKHNAEVKVFIGAAETLARVRLLTDDLLMPGQMTWGQLALKETLSAIRDQRFIIRLPSPAMTIGGGRILDIAPRRKWKRNHPGLVARFERLARGTALDLVSEYLIQHQSPMLIADVVKHTDISMQALDALRTTPLLIWQDDWVIHSETLEYHENRVKHILSDYHTANPLHPGIHANTLRNQLGLSPAAFDVLLTVLLSRGILMLREQTRLHLPSFAVRYTRTQQETIEHTLALFRREKYSPPSVKDTIAQIGEPLLEALISQGALVRISADVLLTADVYREWIDYARSQLQAGVNLRVSSFRDTYNTSRKYALAFLEHLEANQLTRRVGDEHVASYGDWSKLEP
jgi:selenocysteine-specific elongation factor